MNLSQIEEYTRYRLNDYEKPHAWRQKEIFLYANEAEKIICRDARVLEDSTTDSICNIDVAANTLDYVLNSKIIYVAAAKITSSSATLSKVTKQDKDASYPGWRSATASEPTEYILDYRHGYITLYPKPDAAYTLNLSVFRYPENDMALDTDEPEIPEEYHHALVDGICYQAYLKWGERTYDAQKSAVHLQLFRKAIADMKTVNVMLKANEETLSPHGGFT